MELVRGPDSINKLVSSGGNGHGNDNDDDISENDMLDESLFLLSTSSVVGAATPRSDVDVEVTGLGGLQNPLDLGDIELQEHLHEEDVLGGDNLNNRLEFDLGLPRAVSQSQAKKIATASGSGKEVDRGQEYEGNDRQIVALGEQSNNDQNDQQTQLQVRRGRN